MSRPTRAALLLSLAGLTTAALLATGCPSGGKGTEGGEEGDVPDVVLRADLQGWKAQESIRAKRLDGLVFFPTSDADDEGTCPPGDAITENDIDVHRSLLVHDEATLKFKDFSLKRTMNKLAADANAAGTVGLTGEDLFQELWDTQNDMAGAAATLGVHCDNPAQVNGYDVDCRPAEGQEAHAPNLSDAMDGYEPVALVNRLDLAEAGWANCGEYRIIYGKDGPSFRKNLIIFEAILPNPRPGCREGCRDVAKMWTDLSSESSFEDRSAILEDFFYDGLPGFREVVRFDHYSVSGVSTGYSSTAGGQIRTNQFLESPWMLKEFKTALTTTARGKEADVVPVSVKLNPQGELWNQDVATGGGVLAARATQFQSDMLVSAQVAALAAGDIGGITYGVSGDMNHNRSDAQNSSGIDDYSQQMAASTASTFEAQLDLLAAAHNDANGAPLTAEQLANRAETQSCGGCHQPSSFGLSAPGSIGAVTSKAGTVDSWPDSAGFVHVDAPPAVPLGQLSTGVFGTPAGSPAPGYTISPALLDFFLPARAENLAKYMAEDICPCLPRFVLPGRITFEDLRPKLKEVVVPFDERFEPIRERLLVIRERVQKSDDPEARAGARRDFEQIALERDRLIAERNRAIADVLREADPELVFEDLKIVSQPVDFERLQGIDDPSKRRDALVAEVNRVIAETPMRRTVDGTFRVH